MSEERANYTVDGRARVKLLPCPFCGGVAIAVPAAAVGSWRAGCAGRRKCVVEPCVYAPSMEAAVAAWNERKGGK